MFGWWGSPCIDIEMIGMLALLLLCGTLLVGVGGAFLLRGIRLTSGRPSWRGQHGPADEAKLMQELHQGLVRMESRIEALETLLFERERKEWSGRL